MDQIYLDHAATSRPKPDSVKEANISAFDQSGNPGRLAMCFRSTEHA